MTSQISYKKMKEKERERLVSDAAIAFCTRVHNCGDAVACTSVKRSVTTSDGYGMDYETEIYGERLDAERELCQPH